MRKAASLLAGVLLALAASVVFSSTPASAHHYDNYSHFYCAKHRGGDQYTVIHSVVAWLDSGVIGYYCERDFFGVTDRYYVEVSPPGSSNSWLDSYYARCQGDPGGWAACFDGNNHPF